VSLLLRKEALKIEGIVMRRSRRKHRRGLEIRIGTAEE
jgi:hypothetical protein